MMNINNNGRRKVRETPKFVEQGSYGCVMAPALNCDGHINTTSVSKLYNVNKGRAEVEKELKANRDIDKIDPGKTFTLLTRAACHINSARIDPNELHKCEFFENLRTRKELPEMVMENGGVSLEALLAEKDLEFVKSNHADELLLQFWRLFYGISKLSEQKLIHQDIKTANVLVSPEKVVLIDFGIMSRAWTTHYLSAPRNFLVHKYDVFPPEYNLLEVAYRISSVRAFRQHTQIASGSILAFNAGVKPMLDRITITNRDAYIIIKSFLDSHYTEFQTYYENVKRLVYARTRFFGPVKVNCTVANEACKFHPAVALYARHLGEHAGKIDVYSLGVVMLKVVIALAVANTITNSRLTTILGQLIKGMMCPNPEQRFTADKAMEVYKNIMETAKKNAMRRNPSHTFSPMQTIPVSRRRNANNNPNSYTAPYSR